MSLIFNFQRSIVHCQLSRPERSNAFSLDLLREFSRRLDEIRADRSRLVLFISAEGKNFCGGLDLAEASESDENAREMPKLVVEILSKLRRLPQVVVTAVQGAVRAGGAALMAASDLVVAAEDFNVAFPEVKRGLEPVLLFPLLRRKLSASALSELLLTGNPVDAQRARQLGLVHHVVPNGRQQEVALELAEEICRNAPSTIRTAKELILVHETTQAGCSLEEEFEQSLENHILSWHSPAAREGVAAFLEKRPPVFQLLTPDS